ncbi:hypothetical protein ABPG74_001047 [Tetrahymena malaccensis]
MRRFVVILIKFSMTNIVVEIFKLLITFIYISILQKQINISKLRKKSQSMFLYQQIYQNKFNKLNICLLIYFITYYLLTQQKQTLAYQLQIKHSSKQVNKQQKKQQNLKINYKEQINQLIYK